MNWCYMTHDPRDDFDPPEEYDISVQDYDPDPAEYDTTWDEPMTFQEELINRFH